MKWQNLLFALWTMSLLICGCGKLPKPTPCPVKGKLLVNNQPAGGACVRFHFMDDEKRKNLPDACRTNADGSFSLAVRSSGEYAVTMFWPHISVVEGEEIEGADYFNGQHNNLAQPLLKVTIEEGENVLPPITVTYP